MCIPAEGVTLGVKACMLGPPFLYYDGLTETVRILYFRQVCRGRSNVMCVIGPTIGAELREMLGSSS